MRGRGGAREGFEDRRFEDSSDLPPVPQEWLRYRPYVPFIEAVRVRSTLLCCCITGGYVRDAICDVHCCLSARAVNTHTNRFALYQYYPLSILPPLILPSVSQCIE